MSYDVSEHMLIKPIKTQTRAKIASIGFEKETFKPFLHSIKENQQIECFLFFLLNPFHFQIKLLKHCFRCNDSFLFKFGSTVF